MPELVRVTCVSGFLLGQGLRRCSWAIAVTVLMIAGVISFCSYGSLAQTQSQDLAPVMLDGQILFEVSTTDRYTAQERADWIESRLQTAAEQQTLPSITLEERNDLPIITLDERITLLTVTFNDTSPNQNPEQQAALWVSQIRFALLQAQSERSVEVFWNRVLRVISALIVALGIRWLVGRRKQQWHYRLAEALSQSAEAERPPVHIRALQILLRSIFPFLWGLMWGSIVLLTLNSFPSTRRGLSQVPELLNWPRQILDFLIQQLTAEILPIGQQNYSILDLMTLTVIFVGLIMGSSILTNVLRTQVLQVTRIQRGWQEAIATVTKYLLIVIGGLVILQIWGLDLSSLTLIASALGIGLGFGLQNIAKDFGSGLVLIFEQTIKVGDFIELTDYMGTVEHIGGRSTLIRTLDQVSIIVPNSRFLEGEVINWSHLNPISRLHIPVGVAYQSDVHHVQAALLEAGNHHPEVLKQPQPQVFFIGFGDSALEFELLVWIATPSRQPIIKSELNFEIEAALKRHNIEVPFPQRDLHVKSSLPLQISSQLEDSLTQVLHLFLKQHDPDSRNN